MVANGEIARIFFQFMYIRREENECQQILIDVPVIALYELAPARNANREEKKLKTLQ